MRRRLEQAAPVLFIGALLIVWEAGVRISHVPAFILPGPITIGMTLVADRRMLMPALVFTTGVMAAAFLLSAIFGMLLALLMSSARWIERMLYPVAVVFQVTPVVAIAPLIIIWVHDIRFSLLICAWLVAFFPVVANATAGLRSTDPNLISLFRLYGASRWQILGWLKLPAALPFYLAGLQIAGGLSLIGAVVAEFVAGVGGTRSGLAFVIVESGYRLNMSRMFAALFLISLTGLLMYALTTRLTVLVLHHWSGEAMSE